MLENIQHYIAIFLGSTFKFAFGPVYLTTTDDLSVVETAIFTSLGMMATVFIITNLGEGLRVKFLGKKKRKFSRTKRIVRIWRAYGLRGVSWLTPLILTPIGGTIIAMAFGESKKKIIPSMFVSAVVWSLVLCFLAMKFRPTVQHLLGNSLF